MFDPKPDLLVEQKSNRARKSESHELVKPWTKSKQGKTKLFLARMVHTPEISIKCYWSASIFKSKHKILCFWAAISENNITRIKYDNTITVIL